MPPKKKKGKKEPEILEPEHDPSWERSVASGVWQRPVNALPGRWCSLAPKRWLSHLALSWQQ